MNALLVSGVPALCMFLGSLGAAQFDISLTAQARLQSLSAGILITATAEMFHELDELQAAGGQPLLGVVLGFALSALVLFGLDVLIDSDDDNEKEEGKEMPLKLEDHRAVSLDDETAEEVNRRLALIQQKGQALLKAEPTEAQLLDLVFYLQEGANLIRHHIVPGGLDPARPLHKGLATALAATVAIGERVQAKARSGSLCPAETCGRLHTAVQQLEGVRQSATTADDATATKQKLQLPDVSTLAHLIPWSLVLAVVIDAASDGFVIGIAFLASLNSSIVLAFGCAIEMTFVGWTFSATLSKKIPLPVRIALAAAAPLTLVLTCFLGVRLGTPLKEYPTCFVMLTAFGLASIMFLVTQELLPEAHENQKDGRKWHINVWVFIGMAGVILLHSYLPADGSEPAVACPNPNYT